MGLQDKGFYILHNDLSVGSLLFQDTSWRILLPFPSVLPCFTLTHSWFLILYMLYTYSTVPTIAFP